MKTCSRVPESTMRKIGGLSCLRAMRLSGPTDDDCWLCGTDLDRAQTFASWGEAASETGGHIVQGGSEEATYPVLPRALSVPDAGVAPSGVWGKVLLQYFVTLSICSEIRCSSAETSLAADCVCCC